jgi:hypothetical protein
MPFSIRVTSLILPVYCITQTEEPYILDIIGSSRLCVIIFAYVR